MKIANSIVSGGSGPAGTANCGEKLESQGFNIESANECGLGAAGDKVNTDPQLGPLRTTAARFHDGSPPLPAPPSIRAPRSASDARGSGPSDRLPDDPERSPGGNGSDIGAVELQPSNAISLGKLRKEEEGHCYAARQPPAAIGRQPHASAAKASKRRRSAITGQAQVKLTVAATGKAKKKLRKKGKRKVRIEVTYTPTGNSAATVTRNAKLVQKHKKKKHKKKKKQGQHKKRG